MQLPDGSKIIGEMPKYMPQGPCVKIHPDGIIYKGDYLEGKKHGCFTKILADGRVLE
jgi:hypothetical protein